MTPTATSITAAIVLGRRTVDSIAAYHGVNHASAALRTMLKAMTDSGYLVSVAGDSGRGRVFDLADPHPHGAAAHSDAQRRADAADRYVMDERTLDADAALDPDDQSTRARQIREAARSVRDHREAHGPVGVPPDMPEPAPRRPAVAVPAGMHRSAARAARANIGPRRVGGRYYSGYAGEEYTVLAINVGGPDDFGGFSITVANDAERAAGTSRTHCTAWDDRRDRIVREP